jgi:hypothetical protein
MATETWSTRVRNDTDAMHREWRDELLTKFGLLVAAGVLAADETNFVAGAGARPAASTVDTKYAVFHLNDALHATAPIYFRFTVGSGSSFQPLLYMTVGTSTNGSGVLGGTALAVIQAINNNSTPINSDSVRNSFLSCTPGFFGMDWKQGAGATEAFFQISRTVDAAGEPTGTGAIVSWGTGSAGSLGKTQAFGYGPEVAYTAQTAIALTALGFNPQAPITTAVGANTQAVVAWTPTPAMAPVVGVCGVLDGEQATGSTVPATMVGSTTRTYIALSTVAGPFGPLSAATPGGLKYAMLWE